jgi:hypothetical protein
MELFKDGESDPDEISVRKVIVKLKSALRYIFRHWTLLLLFTIAGLLIGLAFSIFEKPTYKATSTFVLEEVGKGGGLGLSQYANLASVAGIDIGSGADKGLFQGDNIIELYKSRLMIGKALLTSAVIDGKRQLLIDRYIEFNKLSERWKEKDHISKIDFAANPKLFSRKEDSLLFSIIKYFKKNVLTVSKPDKKLSIINVETKSKDEVFAQLFNINLVKTVNDFYLQTQTKKAQQSVRILQHQADSIRSMLNNSLGNVASSSDANPNPNPTLHSLLVPYQKKQIDVQSNGALYAEIVKNLELAKIALTQETPLIQLIDEPQLPLDDDRVSKFEGVLLGAVTGFFLALLLIIIRSVFKILKRI